MTVSPSTKIRIAALLTDIQDEGRKDVGLALLVGGLATRVAVKARKKNWAAAKKAMTPADRALLLAEFEKSVGQRLKADDGKAVYVLQVLGLSLAAAADPDPDLREGERLLDVYIAAAEKVFGAVGAPPKPKN